MGVSGSDLAFILTAFILMCVVKSVSAVTCYECNVWKSGYGYTCDEPRIKYNCITCMKIDTTIFMGFYKNTPKTATITSRTCAQSKAVPFLNGCYHYHMADGHNRRCFCDDSDLCNSAPRRTLTTFFSVLSAVFAAAFRLLANY